MAHLFAYGSLMWSDIMARVCGPDAAPAHPPQPARLSDHARHPVRGQDYPGMCPHTGASVSGFVYLDLPETAWARLDDFEGGDYQRSEVLITGPDGQPLRAWTYLFKPECVHQLESGDWDEARFEREGKARFIARYAGFGAVAPR
ncbi:Gamma-glutamyl cyclotransferase, AIG2-like [Roseateles sp. YR242]|uniref:gamma-glutamylcyclotransferase family protein n=1 Tax=Roseateles sp. YR242 TaxID=1855305 RepID=UPI0008AC155E|nr:gamma-glutamylcyclotransferase family protein [Roseateles sp. YR242]SEL49995.1 Gamma-glutamyl cyclotransferase, AIG2-like [Roseateles sp. YR242]